jgi:hypothetical protein
MSRKKIFHLTMIIVSLMGIGCFINLVCNGYPIDLFICIFTVINILGAIFHIYFFNRQLP